MARGQAGRATRAGGRRRLRAASSARIGRRHGKNRPGRGASRISAKPSSSRKPSAIRLHQPLHCPPPRRDPCHGDSPLARPPASGSVSTALGPHHAPGPGAKPELCTPTSAPLKGEAGGQTLSEASSSSGGGELRPGAAVQLPQSPPVSGTLGVQDQACRGSAPREPPVRSKAQEPLHGKKLNPAQRGSEALSYSSMPGAKSIYRERHTSGWRTEPRTLRAGLWPIPGGSPQAGPSPGHCASRKPCPRSARGHGDPSLGMALPASSRCLLPTGGQPSELQAQGQHDEFWPWSELVPVVDELTLAEATQRAHLTLTTNTAPASFAGGTLRLRGPATPGGSLFIHSSDIFVCLEAVSGPGPGAWVEQTAPTPVGCIGAGSMGRTHTALLLPRGHRE
ncbi:synaptojanin-1-like [Mustela erminea]|uniref:synaptojanin-1-like n=1 Tax=Mustela erminea TaxID=36723 RepID=UPI00138698DF|nr:synaptojanin-1-like [Mustela erminea]